MQGYLIFKEGDGLLAYRATEEEAKEFKAFMEITDPDTEAVFTIKSLIS